MSERGGGGPYREAADPNAEALERMRKNIEAEGKHGILIPEDIRSETKFPEFTQLLKKKVDPNDIVFYSLVMGKLKLLYSDTSPKELPLGYYMYRYQNDSYILDITSNGKKTSLYDGFEIIKEE